MWFKRKETGRTAVARRGERLAARRLRRAGYRILARNLVIGADEADIVALDPDGRTIVIVEVKTRAAPSARPPELAIDRRKRRALTRLAGRLHQRPSLTDRPFRFDVIAIELTEPGPPAVRHHVGAFDAEWG